MKSYEAQQILTEPGHGWELNDEQTEAVIDALCLHEGDEGIKHLDHIVAQAKMIIKPIDSTKIEIFHAPTEYELPVLDHQDKEYQEGFYYWHVNTQGMPETEPQGPFNSKKEALNHQQRALS